MPPTWSSTELASATSVSSNHAVTPDSEAPREREHGDMLGPG